MKINFTLEEAKSMLAHHVSDRFPNVNASDITIETIPAAGANYVESICRVRHEFPNCNLFGPNNYRIPAIKRLRELTGISLGEAKWAVERPDEAIDTWIRYGTYLKCS